ncbi:MAG TPA: hypothetical protein DIU35_00260, partial [Candidatus Latescibacteria bacterium]|nr:hypothetical protein [Candidatus Latescibacterota bacterium]
FYQHHPGRLASLQFTPGAFFDSFGASIATELLAVDSISRLMHHPGTSGTVREHAISQIKSN